jgi:hypothetical protein
LYSTVEVAGTVRRQHGPGGGATGNVQSIFPVLQECDRHAIQPKEKIYGRNPHEPEP